jgi:hypothetical protein
VPHNDLELFAARASIVERFPGCATSCHLLWKPPNRHDEALLPLELIVMVLRLQKHSMSLLKRKLLFAKQIGLVPKTYR